MLIAICDDNLHDRNALGELCTRYRAETGLDLEILFFNNTKTLLADENLANIDILFLDIIMNDEALGVQAAHELRTSAWDGAIIFTTSSSEFYPEGFEIDAVHYLIKPVSYLQFMEAMKRALRFVELTMRTIEITVARKKTRILEKDICYIETFGRDTIIHTINEVITISQPLKTIEPLLSEEIFLKSFRNTIVNMNYIAQINEDSFILNDGTSIPISMRNREAICNRFLEYQFSHMR